MLNTPHIRHILPADLPACAKILVDNPLWLRYGLTRASADQMLTNALATRAALLVALAGDEIAGFVWYAPRGAWDRSGYVRLIGVSPPSQGQGIGEALMAAAEIRVAKNSPDMFLLVSDFNADAQRFYRRLGYVQVGTIPDYAIPGITELIFYKRLISPKASTPMLS